MNAEIIMQTNETIFVAHILIRHAENERFSVEDELSHCVIYSGPATRVNISQRASL